MNYSFLCPHKQLKRIGENFDRCLDCGQSLINPKYQELRNKTRQDFTKENRSFTRNFDQNFSNVIDEMDEVSDRPMYEYYTDKNFVNLIKINRQIQFQRFPPVYQTWVNDQMSYLSDAQLEEILTNVQAMRIDDLQYEQLSQKFRTTF